VQKLRFYSNLNRESRKEWNVGESIVYQISWILKIYQVDIFIKIHTGGKEACSNFLIRKLKLWQIFGERGRVWVSQIFIKSLKLLLV
jgi:hypothetical protein